jgi:hypothetical protein
VRAKIWTQYLLIRWQIGEKPSLWIILAGYWTVLTELLKTPNIGKRVQGIPARFLRYHYRAHFIFYVRHDNDLHIIRILHQNMDIARHLGQ